MRDDDDEQHGDRAGDAGHRADLRARDLGERPAAAARRRPQDRHVVHGAGEAAAGDQPDESGRVAALRGQRRPDERSGAGDGGEMMAEEHPAAGRIVVVPVVFRMRRGDARIVERHDLRRDERAVVAVSDGHDRQRGDDDVESLHGADSIVILGLVSPFRRLLGYVRPYRRDFLLGLACVVGTTGIALTAPWVLKHAIDDLTRGVTRGEAGAVRLGRCSAIGVVGGVFRFLMRRILIGASRHIEYDMRNDFFAHLERLPLAYFQAHRTGDLMSRATNDLNAVRMMVGPAVMYSANTLLGVRRRPGADDCRSTPG